MTSRSRVFRRSKDDKEALDAPIDQVVDAAEPAPKPSGAPSRPVVEREKPIFDLGELAEIAAGDTLDMDALMASAGSRTQLDEGDLVKGVVSRVTSHTIFVDIGAKAEAQLNQEEAPGVEVGDTVEGFILEAGEHGIFLTKELQGPGAEAFLDTAKEQGLPVQGLIVKSNSGGYEVKIGTVRGFCPHRLISRIRHPDPEHWVGLTLSFKVLETGDKLLLSARDLEDERAAVTATAFWANVNVGDTHDGHVISARDFGVFVDVQGVEGLVHKSELTWDGGADPESLYVPGTPVSVRVLKVDHAANRLSLSFKDPAGNPWLRVGIDFVTGRTYTGTVKDRAEFGLFVELAVGLRGLVHSSRVQRDGPPVTKGDSVQVRIREIDTERKRIDLEWSDGTGDRVGGSSGDTGSLGTFGDLFKGIKLS